ncbi:hypothetical protein TREES_T100021770 [Tupaia chinensis]|uniref:Uncharacterized protein n=1 Tax=Tupaia chinensis TaxID=246437 RepID=L9JP36_TUPCH|nr:hypothetical protein TREES_T100021770 [Tupaia chinensis]
MNSDSEKWRVVSEGDEGPGQITQSFRPQQRTWVYRTCAKKGVVKAEKSKEKKEEEEDEEDEEDEQEGEDKEDEDEDDE